MRFAGKRPNLDRSTIIYNGAITVGGIPPEAYEYVVNGKSAIDWVMERQCVKTDKASGIAPRQRTPLSPLPVFAVFGSERSEV